MKEKNSVETHEGGLEQDNPENKKRVEEAYGAAAKILDWSNQDEPSFEELDVGETQELAENDPGEPGEVVQMQDESENGKGLRRGIKAGAKNLDSSKQDESSFGEVDVAETEELAEHDPGEPGGNTVQHIAGCGDASMVVLSLWSENLAKLELFCEHGQHRAGWWHITPPCNYYRSR